MDKLSMILIYIGALFAIVSIAIRPYSRLEITKISKRNFILPAIGVGCISLGLLSKVFIEHS